MSSLPKILFAYNWKCSDNSLGNSEPEEYSVLNDQFKSLINQAIFISYVLYSDYSGITGNPG